MSSHSSRIPHVVARMVAARAEAEAVHIGAPMVIAITDAAGRLQIFTRMDDALPVSTELAASKAFTAAVLRMTSAEAGKLAQPGAPLYGIQNTHQGRIVLFGGGIPLRRSGQVVGAIGVSGGSVEEDVHVAEAGVAHFEEMVRWEQTLSGSFANDVVNGMLLNNLQTKLCNLLEELAPALSEEHRTAIAGGVWLSLSSAGLEERV